MSTDKLLILLSKLEERTDQGSVTWEITSNENQFQTVIGNYILRLLEVSGDFSPEPDYVLRIQDHDGAIIESISDTELHQMNPDYQAFQVMSKVFRLARRSAMGVDKAIDSIISELDDFGLF